MGLSVEEVHHVGTEGARRRKRGIGWHLAFPGGAARNDIKSATPARVCTGKTRKIILDFVSLVARHDIKSATGAPRIERVCKEFSFYGRGRNGIRVRE